MNGVRRLLAFYLRVGRIYWSWAPTLLLLAVVVFLPLGLIDAVSADLDLEAIDLNSGFQIAAILLGVGVLTTTSLLGEVFYSGAIAIGLTHPEHEKAPGLREIARHIDYRRLIAIDLLYVLLVVVGLVALLVPGVLAFVFLGLAGPVVEIEKRGVRGALRRSVELVRGSFWFVFFVLVPIELLGDSVGEAAGHQVHHLLGENFFGTWLAESVANSLFSPLFGVAVVLLTIDLIHEKDGEGPAVNRRPAPTPQPQAAGG